jgi:DNA replication and repair protein RecF
MAVDGPWAAVREAGATIVELALTHFRNFRELSLSFEGPPVVLTGPNGAGKTNLLEAISMFAPGGGLRQARLGDIDLRLAGNMKGMAWAAHVRVNTPGGEHSLGTGRDPLGPQQSGKERRVCRINGASARSQSGFADVMSVHWLTPAMDRLFDDGKSGRRRFLDRLASDIDPAQAQRLTAYETALRERGRILRGDVQPDVRDRAGWLDGLENEMAGLASAIGAARLETVRLLNQAMAQSAGAFPQAELSVLGTVEAWLLAEGALAAEDKLRERLRASRHDDAESGVARYGTHRSDLSVAYIGRDLGGQALSAGDCSTGEQKALLISIVLAVARLAGRMRGQLPILLLDEALAHLDAQRGEALFEELSAMGAQAWLTGADAAPFRGMRGRAQFFQLEHGQARLRQD